MQVDRSPTAALPLDSNCSLQLRTDSEKRISYPAEMAQGIWEGRTQLFEMEFHQNAMVIPREP